MSLAFTKEIDKDTYIGLWKLEESAEELKGRLILDEEEESYFHRLEQTKRNVHWLSSRVLLRHLINQPGFIKLENDENGKPFLVNCDYEISLSHSHNYAAAIVSPFPAGVDIEKIRPKIHKIKWRFMNNEELSNTESATDRELLIYWSAKETLFKLYGKKPLSIMENIFIKPFSPKNEGTVDGYFVNTHSYPEDCFRVHYFEYDGYIMTYLTEKDKVVS